MAKGGEPMTLEDFLKVVSTETKIHIAVAREEGIVGAFGYKQKVIQELMQFGICTFKQYEIYSISQGDAFVLGEDEEDDTEEKFINVLAKEN